MKEYRIHPPVTQRHPELTEDDVSSAWGNAIEIALRSGDEVDFWVAVGSDPHGRLIEMVAIEDDDAMVMFHAMTPPSRKTLRELRLVRR